MVCGVAGGLGRCGWSGAGDKWLEALRVVWGVAGGLGALRVVWGVAGGLGRCGWSGALRAVCGVAGGLGLVTSDWRR